LVGSVMPVCPALKELFSGLIARAQRKGGDDSQSTAKEKMTGVPGLECVSRLLPALNNISGQRLSEATVVEWAHTEGVLAHVMAPVESDLQKLHQYLEHEFPRTSERIGELGGQLCAAVVRHAVNSGLVVFVMPPDSVLDGGQAVVFREWQRRQIERAAQVRPDREFEVVRMTSTYPADAILVAQEMVHELEVPLKVLRSRQVVQPRKADNANEVGAPSGRAAAAMPTTRNTKQVKWDDRNQDYMQASEAVVKFTEGKLTLSTLSKVLKPDGPIRYMRSPNHRCRVHIGDFRTWAEKKYPPDAVAAEIADEWLADVAARKAAERRRRSQK